MLAKHTAHATMISVAISSPAVTLMVVVAYLRDHEIGIGSNALCPFYTTFCPPSLVLGVSQGRIGPLLRRSAKRVRCCSTSCAQSGDRIVRAIARGIDCDPTGRERRHAREPVWFEMDGSGSGAVALSRSAAGCTVRR